MNVHHDNWIPRQESLKPLGQQFVHGITHYSNLLSEQGTEWDSMNLEMMFTPDDVNDIKQIAIGDLGMSEYCAWNFTQNGQFTVKSAYHLRMSLNGLKTGQPASSVPF